MPFYDQASGKMRYKVRPVLIVAQADTSDYVALPVSRVTRRENLDPTYDIEIDPAQYPQTGLTAVSYVRTHKQTVVHAGEITTKYGELKAAYGDLYLEILEKRERFSQEISDQAIR